MRALITPRPSLSYKESRAIPSWYGSVIGRPTGPDWAPISSVKLLRYATAGVVRTSVDAEGPLRRHPRDIYLILAPPPASRAITNENPTTRSLPILSHELTCSSVQLPMVMPGARRGLPRHLGSSVCCPKNFILAKPVSGQTNAVSVFKITVPNHLDEAATNSVGEAFVPEATTVRRILIVDDDPLVCSAIRVWLESRSFEVVVADGSESGLSALENSTFDLMIVDIL